MQTIEELIASETAKAKEYKGQANFGWDYFTHKKLSYLEQRRNAFCAERCNQIVELLRELQERRKTDSCEGCSHNNGKDYICLICKRHYGDKYVAERRTE